MELTPSYFSRYEFPLQYRGTKEDRSIKNYCCPIKINRKLFISLSIGVAAVLLIQRLGFQF